MGLGRGKEERLEALARVLTKRQREHDGKEETDGKAELGAARLRGGWDDSDEPG